MLTLTKEVIMVCMLSNFPNLPNKIEGKVVAITTNWVQLAIYNKDGSQKVEIAVEKNKCQEKK